LLLCLGLLFGTTGCIIVHDDHSHDCWEGETACHDDEHVEECIHGRWVVVEHCEDLCGGFCDYDVYDEAVCFCP
jgi:hypothetical protein